jgi:hypothetical protein
MSVKGLIDKYGIEIAIHRATRTADAVGSSIETWTEDERFIGYVAIRGGFGIGGAKDNSKVGKESRSQSATVYFSNAPGLKYSDRLVWTDPILSEELTFEVQSVVVSGYRGYDDGLQFTTVRAEEVRQP